MTRSQWFAATPSSPKSKGWLDSFRIVVVIAACSKVRTGQMLAAFISLTSFSCAHLLAVEPEVSAFDYELSIESRSEWINHFGISVEYKLLSFRAGSLRRIPGDAVGYPVFMRVSTSEEGIEAIAAEEMAFIGKPRYSPEKPEKFFHFELKSLRLSPEGKATIRIRFKDDSDDYSLRSLDANGLRLDVIDVKHGRITDGRVHEFVNQTLVEHGIVYQCNPLTTSASKDGKLLWSSDIKIQGQPKLMAVRGQCLFIQTTAGHSFYVLTDTGELLFYDASLMKGENPWNDIFPIWQLEMDMTYRERAKRGFFRFIRAAVLLDEKRCIPLLIRCVENGQGLPEKCAAIAALEKFNGNPNLWVTNPGPSEILKRVGMNRVFPADVAKAERRKWEVVFRDSLP